MEDLTLQSRVSAVLARDPRTRDAKLDVLAAEGIVTITGTTQSQQVEEAVPVVVRGVDGVREVQSKVMYLPVYPAT
jgi:osmotically-inducible protein OsmY